MPGGPGGAAFTALTFFMTAQPTNGMRDDMAGPRDVIAVDPRGNFPTRGGQENGASECAELYAAVFDLSSQNFPLALEYNRWKQGYSQCLTRFRNSGWDMNQYHTRNMVRDLEEVRKAVNAVFAYDTRWNLYSESYGTLQALHYMRTYPQNVRASLLDSVALPNKNYETRRSFTDPANRALNRLFTACDAIAACRTAHPNLRLDLFKAVSDLNASPTVFVVTQPITGDNVTLRFNGQDLMGLVAGALYRPDLWPTFFRIVRQSAAGNYTGFTGAVQLGTFGLQKFADGGQAMRSATICSDFGRIGVQDSLVELEAVPYLWQSYGLLANVPCESVNVAAAPVGFNVLTSSSVPSLVVAGSFDPVTPPEDAQELMPYLSNGRLASFTNWSHTPVRRNVCRQNILRSFFENPSAPDLSCVATENAKPISF
jgi:pimeloyl-ACP methyl ester carboxylesterase